MKKFIISTAAVIIRGDGVLLAKRPKNARHFPGYWEFPGGKLGPDENPEHGLRRELHEELGVRITLRRERFFTFRDCSDRRILLLAFTCRLRPGRVKAGVETQWVTWKQLAGIVLPPSDRPVREWALKFCLPRGIGQTEF
jgi:8-oxo-dGTP diphosphatase